MAPDLANQVSVRSAAKVRNIPANRVTCQKIGATEAKRNLAFAKNEKRWQQQFIAHLFRSADICDFHKHINCDI